MPRYETVKVTPALAKKWLALNVDNNRSSKNAKIPNYARDMELGNWNSQTGETIKFDTEGRLIDGQNRLRAVVVSGKTITFDIAWDVPISAMQVIDTGAARTAGDALKIMSATDRFRASSVIRWILMWDVGDPMQQGRLFRPTTSEIVQCYMGDPGAFDASSACASDCQQRGLGTGAPAGVAHHLFTRIDPEHAHSFFEQYKTGANLPASGGVVALRNRMARLRIDRTTRQEQLALFIRAWNAFREDRPVQKLMISRDELANENFPRPI